MKSIPVVSATGRVEISMMAGDVIIGITRRRGVAVEQRIVRFHRADRLVGWYSIASFDTSPKVVKVGSSTGTSAAQVGNNLADLARLRSV